MNRAEAQRKKAAIIEAVQKDDTMTTEQLTARYGVSRNVVRDWLCAAGLRAAKNEMGGIYRAGGRDSRRAGGGR